MKFSVTLASLVYLTPTIIQAFPHSYEDGTLDVRDAPEALHNQVTRNYDAEPIGGSSDETRPHLIYEKGRRDAEFTYENPHDVSNAHGEELMIERDAFPIVNSEANTYPRYRNHGEHSKLQHTRKHGKSHKSHQSKHQNLHPDEQSQGAVSSVHGEKDPAKANDPDLPVRPRDVAENDGRVAAKPDHEERDIEGTGHQERVGNVIHTTRPHVAKATRFIHGEKDPKKPLSADFHAKLNKVAAVQGKVPVKPAGPVVKPPGAAVKHHHEAREAQEAKSHPAHPNHLLHSHKHTAVHKAHGPKATFFIHGEKDAAKPSNSQFHSKLHDVAAKQGRLRVKPAGPVVKPAGAIPKHHQQARDVEPATTHSHHHHHEGTSIPLASKTAIQEKVAKILEHEFPQYSAKIEQHLKEIQAHEVHIVTKREAEPLAQATATSNAHHHHTRAHLPAASRVILEAKVAAVLEHNYPQYSGKIEEHLKELQAHHQKHHLNPQSTGHPKDHSKREPEAEFMDGVEDEHVHRRGIVERHPEATPPPALEDQQPSLGKSHGRKNAGHPMSHAILPPASRSVLNEEIASILEEEYPQYSSKIAAHMKAYRARQTGTPNAYQGGILDHQQPAMKALHVAKPHQTGLTKRQLDTPTEEDGVLAHNGETSQTTNSHLKANSVLLKDYPNPTGRGHYEEDEHLENKEDEHQANSPATKLSEWEQYLLNATLHHQLFAAPAEAAAPNPINSGKVEARGLTSMTDPITSMTDPTTTSHDFGYFGYTHVPHIPVAEEVLLKQALPLQKLAHEVLQGTATVSGGYHMASASGVVVSALEKELPVGPNGENENMLDLDVTMPAAAIREPEYMNPLSRPYGMNHHTGPGLMAPVADADEGIPNIPRPGERTGRSGAPGWLSELVAEDRAAVMSVDSKIPLPTGSLQQQLAAFNELEATVSHDSPLATNTKLAEQLSANNGLMYDGPIPARPQKPGLSDPSTGYAMSDDNSANDYTPSKTGESIPSAENAIPDANAANGEGPSALGAKNVTQNVAVKAAANPYPNEAGGDMSQDPAATAKLDPQKIPMEHMRRNLWDILGVSDDV
ncbi:hypothetical protein MMC17_004879 [Xylographa soralifera]|nr:hypothetical protein [Xylographa soralifera]